MIEADDDTQFVNDLWRETIALFGREGWDDPAMDIYNDLDPRVSQ